MTRSAICLALVLIGLPASAWAQPSSDGPTLTDDDRARELYLRGERMYAAGDYDEAIDLFRQAYELSGRAALLFNLANAYERAGRLEAAIDALRRYAPSAPEYDQATVNARITALEARVEAEGTGGVSPGPGDLPPPRYSTPAPRRGAGDGGGGGGGGGDGGLIAAGVVFLGLGLAAGGVGIGLGLAKTDATNGLALLCPGGVCVAEARELLDRESGFALGADISWAAAGALGITGLVLLIVGATSGGDSADGAAAWRVLPSAGPQGGGVHVVGTL